LSAKLYITCLLCINISACSIYTEFNVHKPIEIKQLKHADAIIILNRFPAKHTYNICNFLKEYLTLFNYYKTINIINKPLSNNNLSDSLQTTFTHHQIDSICHALNAQHIISLEYFKNVKQPFFTFPKKQKNELFSIGWKIYSTQKKDIVYEYFKIYKRENYLKDSSEILKYLIRDNKIFDSYQFAAFDLAYRISDFWLNISQSYYVGGNKMIRMAARYTYDDTWIKAADIWLDLIYHPNKRIRRYAFHNLAVYYAGKGNYFTAIEFLEQALAIKQHAYSKDVLKILKEQLYIETKSVMNSFEQKYLNE
jgi:hypothetical protein